MNRINKWNILYVLSFSVMIFLNYWSATDVGTVAEQEQAIIQPAGYAFSIWGVIYLALLAWLGSLFKGKLNKSMEEKLTFWPILNFLLNGLWIIAFTGELLGLSVVVIIGLLGTLIVLYKKITTHKNNYFWRFPFSIYFGWVTVATIVNIFTWVKQMGISTVLGVDEFAWTMLLLSIGTILCLFISLKHKDWIYPLVFIWSYLAIFFEHQFSYISLAIVLLGCIIVQIGSAVKIIFDKVQA